MLSNSHRPLSTARMLCGLLILLPAFASAESEEGVIIECVRPCTAAIQAVRGLGGRVTEQFQNVDAVAARVPHYALSQLAAALGSQQVSKDQIVGSPVPRDLMEFTGNDRPVQSQALTGAALTNFLAAHPNNYLYNGELTGAASLHAQGKIGQGVIVAVIDSGTANWSGVFSLAGTVIGGENLVAGDFSATSRSNDPHGTWVGTMIAGFGFPAFPNASALAQAVLANSPESAFQCPTDVFPTCPAGLTVVPLIGTAPGASIYAIKVFPSPAAGGGGAPESRIIAAMDRAITLRRNFNNGVPSAPVSGDGSENNPYVYDSLKIDVVNMSLGGPTLFAGHDLEDRLTKQMLAVGMTIVTSAGNDGPGAMTGGSPGTGIGSLTTGAANTPTHERILRYAQFGPVLGPLYRANNHIQTADFSSRGPTADGRHDPQIVANGYASYVQSASGSFALASGTSFSSPTVAGAAALLRAESPSWTATQIRNALVDTANPNVLGDKSRINDQGKGFLNVPAALNKLTSGKANKLLPDLFHIPTSVVALNVLLQGDKIVTFNKNNSFSTRVNNLVPGQMAQFFVPTDPSTEALTVTLKNIVPEFPPGQQNQLFGDDIFLNIFDAPTSFGEYRVFDFVFQDTTYEIPNPQTGLVRVALQGDWTNAGRISADVVITRTQKSFGKATAGGRIHQGEQALVNVNIPANTVQAVIDLHWVGNWGRYPTSDLDMLLVDPANVPNFDGATISSPERVVLDNPTPGIWTIVVDGFTINEPFDHTPDDDWVLRVTADGTRLKKLP